MLPHLLLLTLLLAASSQPIRSPKKIALLHLHDDAPFFADLGALTLSSKRRYADRHSYELVSHTPQSTQGLWRPSSCDGATLRGNECFIPANHFEIDPRAPTFGKIKLALAACVGRQGYWMLWSDADAMPVNHSVHIESLIDDRYDLAVSVDWLMINAGVILMKCSAWTTGFLERVYKAREFDDARALDQSAFQHFFDNDPSTAEHVYYIPKRLINVYVEEYQPGDFMLHMAGKLYEATTEGALAIAHQFDVLSRIDDVDDVAAFFTGQHLLGMYSGVCIHGEDVAKDSECRPDDDRRLKLREPLISMSHPNRYRHVGMRYYWLGDWKDQYDREDWGENRKVFVPESDIVERDDESETDEMQESHDEL